MPTREPSTTREERGADETGSAPCPIQATTPILPTQARPNNWLFLFRAADGLIASPYLRVPGAVVDLLPSPRAGRSRFSNAPGRPAGAAPASYSWLPGTGLNLIPRNATPTGATVDASMVIAVQMMFIDVAAIAAVPWPTKPVPNDVSV